MRSARTSLSKTGNGTLTLDLLDAMELSEVLDYLNDWLRGADAHVRADLHRFGCDNNATTTVCRRLSAFAELLVTGQADDDDIYPGRGHDHHSHNGFEPPVRDTQW